MSKAPIRIGGASGFWGDASIATPQLLAAGNLDYLVYDYLAEITMSIMARARFSDPNKGYATDFVHSTLKPNLPEIARQGVKVIANAGGVNPRACAKLIREIIQEQGLDLKVAVVMGDDLIIQKESFARKDITEMFSGEVFPDPDCVASINAYLGAFPIALALDEGADIVITGRCVDSAVTLGACIHEFGWGREDFQQLAQGSLAGHILECGTQATGGNFTDWELLLDSFNEFGYPIAEISQSGDIVVSKPDNTGGMVTVGTVAEQMLYEIGDPQHYVLPDVVCDFSEVQITQLEQNRVAVSGAKGHGAPDTYKVSATYADGYRAGHILTFYGRDADVKAVLYAQTVLKRAETILAENQLGPFTETCIEVVGAESHYGAARQLSNAREVDLKVAVKHASQKGVGVFLKELVGLYLSGPPGLTGFAGARPKPSPVVRLFSFLLAKKDVDVHVEIENAEFACKEISGSSINRVKPHTLEFDSTTSEKMTSVPLELLAWGRSGDKGNKANIGLIARHAELLPWIAAKLDASFVANYFKHFINSEKAASVERFYLPGTHALNFLIHDVLGGGGMASLRSDPQGKGYAQLLLAEMIEIPESLSKKYNINK